jgi:hypothetical protein
LSKSGWVRAWALRRKALILLQIFSMGLKLRGVGAKEEDLGPGLRNQGEGRLPFVRRELSMMTTFVCGATFFRGYGTGLMAHYFVGIGRWVTVQCVNKIALDLRGLNSEEELERRWCYKSASHDNLISFMARIALHTLSEIVKFILIWSSKRSL